MTAPEMGDATPPPTRCPCNVRKSGNLSLRNEQTLRANVTFRVETDKATSLLTRSRKKWNATRCEAGRAPRPTTSQSTFPRTSPRRTRVVPRRECGRRIARARAARGAACMPRTKNNIQHPVRAGGHHDPLFSEGRRSLASSALVKSPRLSCGPSLHIRERRVPALDVLDATLVKAG